MPVPDISDKNRGQTDNAHHGPDSYGHNQSESPKPPIPMPVDVLPNPARDMPESGVEEFGDDDDLLDEDRQRDGR